jgi:ABC-type cobalamin/Fe3+-siderophores transport system ATPase subunit
MKPILSISGWEIIRQPSVHIGPFDIELMPSDVVTIMGPSGIGKTTLLMSILGYNDPQVIVRGGRTMTGTPLDNFIIPKNTLYIPQRQTFNPNWEIQSFLCRLPWGNNSLINKLFPRRKSRRLIIDDVLKNLNLLHRKTATISELSGGEIQRAAIAQVMLLRPKIIVGDEFVSALDPGISDSILLHLQQISIEEGCAALLALHDIDSAMKISNRIFLLWPESFSTLPTVIERGTFRWWRCFISLLVNLSRWSCDSRLINSVHWLYTNLNTESSSKERFSAWLSGYETSIIFPPGFVQLNDGDKSQLINYLDINEHTYTDIHPFQVFYNRSVVTGVYFSPIIFGSRTYTILDIRPTSSFSLQSR